MSSTAKKTADSFIQDFKELSQACEIMNSEVNKKIYMQSLKNVGIINLLTNFNLADMNTCIENITVLNEAFKNIRILSEKPASFSYAYFTKIETYQKRFLLKENPIFNQFFTTELENFFNFDDIDVLPDLHSVIAFFALSVSKGKATVQEKNIVDTPYGTVEFSLYICSENFIASLYELEKMAKIYSQSQTFKKQATYENFLQKSLNMNNFMKFQAVISNKDYYLDFSH